MQEAEVFACTVQTLCVDWKQNGFCIQVWVYDSFGATVNVRVK